MKQFITEIFQDTDGGASAKRFAFFVVLLFFIAISTLVLFHGISADLTSFANSVTEKCQDLIKWLGGYILADKTPAALRALKGDAQNRTVSTVTRETVEPPADKGPTGG